VTVSEVKRPLRNRFGSETVKKYITVICNGHSPPGHKFPFGCNGYVTAMAVGQGQRLYSGVRMFTGYYLSSTPRALRFPGVYLELKPFNSPSRTYSPHVAVMSHAPCMYCHCIWSEGSERPAARAAVRAVRSGPLPVVIVIRYHTIPNIDSLYIVMPPPHVRLGARLPYVY
jgi:hypothetical protein